MWVQSLSYDSSRPINTELRGAAAQHWLCLSNIVFTRLFVFSIAQHPPVTIFSCCFYHNASRSASRFEIEFDGETIERGAETNREREGGEYRQKNSDGAQQESRLSAGWCLCFFILSSFLRRDCWSIKNISPPSLRSSFLTSRILPDPESPASSGCFNKFIRVKLTHWIKSDGGESCSAAGPLCNSTVQIWVLHLLSLASVRPRLRLRGIFYSVASSHIRPFRGWNVQTDQGGPEGGRSRTELSVGLSAHPHHCFSPVRRSVQLSFWPLIPRERSLGSTRLIRFIQTQKQADWKVKTVKMWVRS